MPPNQPNQFAKFSSMALQMAVIIGVSAWGGVKLDDYFQIKAQVFTIVLSLLGIGVAMYVVIKELTKSQK